MVEQSTKARYEWKDGQLWDNVAECWIIWQTFSGVIGIPQSFAEKIADLLNTEEQKSAELARLKADVAVEERALRILARRLAPPASLSGTKTKAVLEPADVLIGRLREEARQELEREKTTEKVLKS